ncbi:MAG TPA: DUF4159 domain-containing protein [Tepidisphaeraceae bacterium]|nr:DUF4159 domain-containing protein [Tepidisphaeraceae bacterium]
MTRRPCHAWTALALLLTASVAAPAEEFKNPKANIPPKATPQRRNAGEGLPPLPLPATPLRRSEKKREPSPPALVGTLTFSDTAQKKANFTWETTIIDIEKWVNFTNDQLGQRYRFVATDFSKFSYDPAELPIVYLTGWKPLPEFDEGTIARLRQYLTDGGTWVVHSNCGRPEFNKSFRQQIARIFPDRELAPIPTDHPLFQAFHKITEMRVRKDRDPWKTIPPLLETVNIGTRAAVIFSPIDVSCGWDADANPIDGGILYHQHDALKLGANITTYCLAEYQYARFFAHAKIYHQADLKTRDQLVLGQLVHNGDWDPTPHGLPNLLKQIDESTTLNVQFKRTPVDPEKGELFAFPVIYMTGQRKFTLSDAAAKRLREYLDNGGTLVVDCAAGSSEFDKAFREQIKKVYADRPLKPLAPDHPLFSFVHDAKKIALAPLAKQLAPGVTSPQIEAIEVEGVIRVIYSPLSLSAGWEQLPRAYNKGYADPDALKLGVNVLMYVVSH